jgi:hypothetical protein
VSSTGRRELRSGAADAQRGGAPGERRQVRDDRHLRADVEVEQHALVLVLRAEGGGGAAAA